MEIKKNSVLKQNDLKSIIPLVKKNANAKFDESIDATFRLNKKKSKGDINIRTVINLPHGIKKKIKIAVICEDNKIDEAKKSGADLIGSDNLINDITSGKLNFDKLIATPGTMLKVGKLGKVLGPKGLMPNPKLGTVTNNIKKAVEDLKSGQIELKSDKDGNILLSIGKKSFPDENIIKNYNFVKEIITKEKPESIKGDFILSSYISSTMGVSFKIKSNKGIQK